MLEDVRGFCYNCGRPLFSKNEMTIVTTVDENGKDTTSVALCTECACSLLDYMTEHGED